MGPSLSVLVLQQINPAGIGDPGSKLLDIASLRQLLEQTLEDFFCRDSIEVLEIEANGNLTSSVPVNRSAQVGDAHVFPLSVVGS